MTQMKESSTIRAASPSMHYVQQAEERIGVRRRIGTGGGIVIKVGEGPTRSGAITAMSMATTRGSAQILTVGAVVLQVTNAVSIGAPAAVLIAASVAKVVDGTATLSEHLSTSVMRETGGHRCSDRRRARRIRWVRREAVRR